MAKKVNVDEVREQIARDEQEIRCLEASLSSVTSDIGDWKIAKCQEYALVGLDAPYDIDELHQKRQQVRDQINAYQDEIAELQSQLD